MYQVLNNNSILTNNKNNSSKMDINMMIRVNKLELCLRSLLQGLFQILKVLINHKQLNRWFNNINSNKTNNNNNKMLVPQLEISMVQEWIAQQVLA